MFIKENYLKKTVLNISADLNDAIKSLNNSGLQIVIIVDKNKNFLGTITDGDVRRGLIKGYNLKSSVKKVLNTKPITSKIHVDKNEAENILRKNDLIHLPLIEKKKLSGLYFKGNAKKKENYINNKIIIMAGGYGTRLGKLTKKTPKGMLKLRGKPLLVHIIEKLKREGFKEVYISIYYLKKKIKEYFLDGDKLGIKIKYIEEKYPMGTVGSLSLLNKKLEDSFFLVNCDVITGLNFGEMLSFHQRNQSDTTLAIKNFEFINPYGVIKSRNNKFKNFEEKPSIFFNINAGIYLFKPEILNVIKKNKIKSIPKLFEYLKLKNKKIFTYPMYESWEDHGLNIKKLES